MRLTGQNAASASSEVSQAPEEDRVQLLEPALWKQLGEAADFPSFSISWLALQCGLIGNVAGGVVLRGSNSGHAPVAIWPTGWDCAALAGVIELAAAQRRGVVRYGSNSADTPLEARS